MTFRLCRRVEFLRTFCRLDTRKSIGSGIHSITVHEVVIRAITVFYRVGYWHRGDQPTTRELRTEAFYCLYYSLLFISLAVGAIKSGTIDESIFLCEISLATLVLIAKFCIFIWKQKRIVKLLEQIGVFSIRNAEDVAFFNLKMGKFMKFVVVFLSAAACAVAFACLIPFFSSERKMFIDFAFPLDRRNGGLEFWISYAFISTELVLTFSPVLFSTIIWCLMLLFSLRYEIIGNDIANMGRIDEEKCGKLSEKEKQNLFRQDLKSSIDGHRHLRGLTDELVTFFSKLFLLQFGTSAACICGSVYCLAFDIGDNILERLIHLYSLFYNISELFMITYFGNEIMLSSSRLTYKLIESDWVDQPQSTKKDIIIFCEYLKQPHEILIGKLYPLTLQTFTRILNSAYSFFNILKSVKH